MNRRKCSTSEDHKEAEKKKTKQLHAENKMNFSLEYALRARGSAAPKKAKSRSYALIVIVVVPTAAAALLLFCIHCAAAPLLLVFHSKQQVSVAGNRFSQCKFNYYNNKIIYTHTHKHINKKRRLETFVVYISQSERDASMQ